MSLRGLGGVLIDSGNAAEIFSVTPVELLLAFHSTSVNKVGYECRGFHTSFLDAGSTPAISTSP